MEVAPKEEVGVLVHIIEDDEILAAETARQLEHFGFNTKVFHNTSLFEPNVTEDEKIKALLILFSLDK